MDYLDVVQTVSRAYWGALLDNDEGARVVARQAVENLGFPPEAADTVVQEFSRQPLMDWLTQGSAVS